MQEISKAETLNYLRQFSAILVLTLRLIGRIVGCVPHVRNFFLSIIYDTRLRHRADAERQ